MPLLPALCRSFRRKWCAPSPWITSQTPPSDRLFLPGGCDRAVGQRGRGRREEEGEWEDNGNEVVGAIGGWDNSIREALYQGNADELFHNREDDEPWVGDGGIRNWDNMAHVWDPEEEEDRDYYLGGLRCGLRRLP